MASFIDASEFGVNSNMKIFAPHGDDYLLDPRVPEKASFVFTGPYLESMARLMKDPCGDIIVDYGGSGKGKTDGPRQFAARTNWPLFEIEGTKETSFQLDLMGRLDPATGKFIPGPAYSAMKIGGILLINEADVMQAGELIPFYEIYHGLEVAATGEFIQPHPAFRVMFTFNNGGLTGLSGMRGTTPFSDALVDRFIPVRPNVLTDHDIIMMMTAKLKANTEKWTLEGDTVSDAIISAITGYIPKIVEVFREVDDAVRSARETGDLSVTNGVALGIPMSYRVLNRWTREMARIKGNNSRINRLVESFDEAYGHRLKATPEIYMATHKLCQGKFGTAWPDPTI